jgi:hypothetical protein
VEYRIPGTLDVRAGGRAVDLGGDRQRRPAARAAWQRAVQLLDRFEHRSTDDVRAKLRGLASG